MLISSSITVGSSGVGTVILKVLTASLLLCIQCTNLYSFLYSLVTSNLLPDKVSTLNMYIQNVHLHMLNDFVLRPNDVWLSFQGFHL